MASSFTIDTQISPSRINLKTPNFNSPPQLLHRRAAAFAPPPKLAQTHVPKCSLGVCSGEKKQFLGELEVAAAKSLHTLVPKCSVGGFSGKKIQFLGEMEVPSAKLGNTLVRKWSVGWSNGEKKQFLGETGNLVQTLVPKCSVGWSNGEKKQFLGETGSLVQTLVPKCSVEWSNGGKNQFLGEMGKSVQTHVLKCSVGWSNGEKIQSLGEMEVAATTTVAPSTVELPLLSMGMREVKDIGEEKIGVLLLNLGGPETLDDVQPFLFNLFADPDIIRLPRLFRFLQKPLAQFISVVRAPKSKEGYASIGGGSPLRRITDDQAEELRKALCVKDVPAKVYVGMRYWHPFTEEAIDQIKRDGITKLVVLPLYPQFSISTSGSSLRLLESIFREDEYLVNMQHTVIPSWYQREGYIKAMADLIQAELKKFDIPQKVMIFFSAHGVPLAYVEEAGDPYKAEMEECVDLIMEELEKRRLNNAYTLAYQSRVGPVEWLKPYTDDTIIELGRRGVKRLLAVPISFVSEHIETLEEIDVEYKELALESGIEKWGRVPALGCEPTFIADLADAVIESLPYVGAMAVSNLEARQSLVPLGSVEELLAVYDSKRKELPPPVTVWEWGWTKSAETWNGRVAMLAVFVLLVFEVTTGEGLLHQWGILPLSN